MDVQKFKRELEAKEKELSKSVQRLDTEARNQGGDDTTADWSDASVNDQQKSEDFEEADVRLETLNEVRDALRRIEQGKFGKCVVDGGPIEEKRLQAIPWTKYCLKHEQEREKKIGREMPTM
jgi:DnaK suppressor protein